jgi:hypothetical protein
VGAADILDYLQMHGFDIFTDVWAENNLYFGKKGNEIIETDKMFGSKKFQLPPDRAFLDQAAKKILSAQISPSEFDHSRFLKTATDIIAIEKSLAQRMKQKWLE